MGARFKTLAKKAEALGLVLDTTLVGPYPYKTYKKEENHWDCLLWKTLADVEDALDNHEMMEDMNWFKNTD